MKMKNSASLKWKIDEVLGVKILFNILRFYKKKLLFKSQYSKA